MFEAQRVNYEDLLNKEELADKVSSLMLSKSENLPETDSVNIAKENLQIFIIFLSLRVYVGFKAWLT